MKSLGLIEVPFLSVAAVVADGAAKSADVRVLGLETTGNENILIRIEGMVDAVSSAIDAAADMAGRLGSRIVTSILARPDAGIEGLIHFANAQNPLYGGRDQFLSTDYYSTKSNPMHNTKDALGIIETQGLTAALEATDAMLKTANVSLVGKEKIGAAYVTIIVRGDVAAVKAAIDAGQQAIGTLGKLIAAHVIARPHEDLIALLPKP